MNSGDYVSVSRKETHMTLVSKTIIRRENEKENR